MQAIYFPEDKVQILIAESGQDRAALRLNAMALGAAGKPAVSGSPVASVFGTDPRSFFADDVKESAAPKAFAGDAPKMQGAKYADGSVVTADEMMGEPTVARVAPTADVPPHPHGAIVPRHVEGVRGALYRYHDMIVSGKVKASQLGQAARRFVHSEFVAALVKLSPTPADDVILELLRSLVPPPEEPAK